jgi:tRNA(adenine34) deaminase
MNLISTDLAFWMREAITEAKLAHLEGDVPIGCVIIHKPTGQIIGRGRNRRILDSDATAHAEIIAIRQAGTFLKSWRLIDCVLIVTLEPCPMCAGAIVNARIPDLIYGCPDPKAGAVDTLFQLCQDKRLNHQVNVQAGVLSEECAQLLRDFFKEQRTLGKK